MSRLTIDRIRMNGFGPGRDVDIDLSDAAGVIVLDGPNGAGKTCFTETGILGAIYRKTSRGPLKDIAEVKGATLETVLRNGSQIVLRHSIDATIKNARQEAVWVNGTASSGKVRDFDLAREADPSIPSFELLTASAFSMQGGSGNLADLDVAQRKTVLAELLGLAKYQRYHEYAKERVKTLKDKSALIEMQIEELTKDVPTGIEASLMAAGKERTLKTAELESVREEMAKARAELVKTEADLSSIQERVDAYDERLRAGQRLRDEHLEAVGALNRARVARQEVADLSLRLAEVERIGKALEELTPKITEATAEREKVLQEGKGHSKLIEQAETDIARYRDVLERADEIRTAQERVGDLTGELSEAEEEVRQADQECERNRKRVEAHRKAQGEVERLEERIVDAERGCSHLDRVPFGDDCIDSGCPYIADAVKTKGMLEQVRESLAASRARLDPDSVADLTSSEARLRAARESVDASYRSLEAARASAGDLPLLRAAESRSEDLKARVEVLKAERENIRCDYRSAADDCMDLERQKISLTTEMGTVAPEGEQRLRDTVAASKAEAEKIDELVQKVDRIADDLDKAQKGLGERPDDDSLRAQARALRADVTRFEGAESGLLMDIDDLGRRIATLEAHLEHAMNVQGQKEKLLKDQGGILAELSRWKVVSDAYSRKGLQALLLDAAGPRISELCNQLLDVCMSHFQVKLVTTRASSDGKKLIEDLDLVVFDSRKGAQRSFTDLSGGEGVLVTLALRMAIMLHGGAGSATDFLILDELDGALDDKTAQGFLPMLREAMRLGDLRFVLLTSHREAVKAQADAVMRFQPQMDGTTTVKMEARI